MIRNLTILLAGVVLVLSFALYHLKYRAETAARTVVALQQSIAREREHIKLLRADWSNLTSPRRLDVLARRHLGFKQMSPRQIVTMDRISELAPEREPDLSVYDAAGFEKLLGRLPGDSEGAALDGGALTDLLIQLRKQPAREGGSNAR